VDPTRERPQGGVKTYVIDVNTTHTPEEDAHGPRWPNGLVITIIIIIIIIMLRR
jgi:hypothetical protein